MRLLLDTHIAIWAVATPDRLTRAERDLISDPDNDVMVSVVSLWEIAIKRGLGRPGAPPFSAREAAAMFTQSGYRLLPVEPSHVLTLETLPPIHADPFDRMLAAQALTEPLRLLSHDHSVLRYLQAGA